MRVEYDDAIERLESMTDEKTFKVGYFTHEIRHSDGTTETYTETDGTEEDHQRATERAERVAAAYGKHLQPVTVPPPVSVPPIKLAPTILELGEHHYKRWLHAKMKWLGNAADEPSDSVKRYNQNAAKFFALINGNLRIDQITLEHLQAFDTHFPNLPSRVLTNKESRHHQSLNDLKNAGIYGKGTLTGTTAHKKCMGAIKKMLSDAYSMGLISKSVGALHTARIELPIIKDNSKRLHFTPSDLKAIFDSPFFLNGWRGLDRDGQTMFWMFIMALYSGARNGELLYLGRSSVEECPQTGIWYLSIVNEIKDAQVMRTAKNKNSIRKIPIHDAVIKLGFLDFHKQATSDFYLFSTISERSSSASSQFSSKASALLDAHGAHIPNRKTFYSFRHTIITHAVRNASIGIEAVSALTGHIQQDEEPTLVSETVYLGDLELEDIKKNVVDKIWFGLKIEEGLKPS
ncbi:MAG: integrase [Motiliproteus sp.]|jgi:integrase